MANRRRFIVSSETSYHVFADRIVQNAYGEGPMKRSFLLSLAFLALSGFESVNAALIDNGDGTISDNTTGLMWIKDADTFNGLSWDEARTQIQDASIAGYSDWRLPEITELENLYSTLSQSGVFVPTPFSNLEIDGSTDWYWSNTAGEPVCWYTACSDTAYYFRFDLGITGSGEVNYKLNALAVRTDANSILCEFRDNGDNTITDTRTGLMWPKDAMSREVPGGSYWRNAETAISQFVYAGYSDWRLPTLSELEGLYNIFTSGGSFDASPFNFIITSYTDWRWSSTKNTFFDFETGAPGTSVYGAYFFPVREDSNTPRCNQP